jgi:hypothetical protein
MVVELVKLIPSLISAYCDSLDMLRLLLLYHCPTLCRRLDELELRPDLYATRFVRPTCYCEPFNLAHESLCLRSDRLVVNRISWLVTMMAADLEINILLRLWDGMCRYSVSQIEFP